MARSNGKLVNMGVKLTVDSADKRIPIYLKPNGGILSWAPGKVDVSRAVQTVVAYGLDESIDLKWWYDRVSEDSTLLELDYLSADERIDYGLSIEPSIIDEVIDIVGQKRLEGWWPHLELDLMRRHLNGEDDKRIVEPNGPSDRDNNIVSESSDA